LYKTYLKGSSKSIIEELSSTLLRFFENLRSINKYNLLSSRYQIYLSSPQNSIIDVAILDTISDELQSTDQFKLENVLNFEIITSIKLTKEEILSHIFWSFKNEFIQTTTTQT
jgi:hypothetical protein